MQKICPLSRIYASFTYYRPVLTVYNLYRDLFENVDIRRLVTFGLLNRFLSRAKEYFTNSIEGNYEMDGACLLHLVDKTQLLSKNESPEMRGGKIFSGNSNPELSNMIAEKLNSPLSNVWSKKFMNGEIAVELKDSIRNDDVFVIQSGCGKVNDNVMELLIMINACRYASARRIVAVLANLLQMAGVNHVITMDLHASQIQGFFTIPIDNLSAENSIYRYIIESIPDYQNLVAISRNSDSTKRVTSMADKLKVDFAILHKVILLPPKSKIDLTASLLNLAEGELTLVGNVANRNVVIIDDMINGSKPFLKAAKILKENGAKNIYIIATHGIFTGDALKEFQQSEDIHQIVVTNTIPVAKTIDKLKVIDVSPVLAEAIRRVRNGESITCPNLL